MLLEFEFVLAATATNLMHGPHFGHGDYAMHIQLG
jgi:hypothetical protein